MLEERYRKLGENRDSILQGFGHSDGVPGFWCRRAKFNDIVDCLRNCAVCLSCGERFAPIRSEDKLDCAKFDWGLMVLTGEIRPPFGELGLPAPHL